MSSYLYLVYLDNAKNIDLAFQCVFFFQAEDGIRDLVRSRGLGDVYKRQPYLLLSVQPAWLRFLPKPGNWMVTFKMIMGFPMPVSYTHLTLPTSDLV